MDQAKVTQAWNNFVGSSDPARFQAVDLRWAAYISKTFMGLACSGGLAYFVSVYAECSMPEVVRALDQIGAAKAARELERVLPFVGADPPGEYEESLSREAAAELKNVLEAHVLANLACYLGSGDAH